MRNHKNCNSSAITTVLSAWKMILFLLIPILTFYSIPTVSAQCPLTCKANANVSLGVDGKSTITIYTIMNNPPPSCIPNYKISLMDNNGKPISNPVTCEYLGQTIKFSVLDTTNGNSCWGNLFIEDKLAPQLICSDITLECNQSTEVDSVGKAIATDNCDSKPIILSQGETVTQIDCDNQQGILYMISRVWIAKDKSGNFSLPCTQKIIIRRPILGLVQYPPDYTLGKGNYLDCSTSDTTPAALGEPTYKGRPLTLMCKIIFTHSDSVDMRCSGTRTILRTWIVVDCCTNIITKHLQTIMLVDKTPPNVICPADFIVPTKEGKCTADVTLPVPVVSDNCSKIIKITISGSGFGNLDYGPYLDVQPGFYEVKYTVCDDCSNCTSCQVAFEVKELELPVVICNSNITVTLDGTGNGSLTVNQINNGTYDNCCLDSLDIKIMGQPDSLFGQVVNFDCEDINKSFLVILRATDCHGNVNFCMANVTVVDNSPPNITCPPDLTVFCTDPVIPDSTGIPTINDICGIDTLFYTDSLKLNPCNTGDIFRIWTAIDSAGNIGKCIQHISVVDITAPIIGFPPDITINCLLNPDSTLTGTPIAFDDCSKFKISHSDQFINVPQGCNRIERLWKIFNLCDSSVTTDLQNIVLFDNTSPVWVTKQGTLDVTIECDKDLFLPVPIAADNCSFLNVVKTGDVSIPICKNKYTRILTYRAIDGCENSSIPFVVNIKVNDIKAPVLNNCPKDTVVQLPADSCSKYISFIIANATDNCGDVTVTNNSPFATNNNSGNISGTYPIGIHIVKIFADDGCGNRDTCTVNIEIKDVTPPVADCADITISIIGSIQVVDTLFILYPEVVLQDFNYFDLCSPVTLSADPDTFHCEDSNPPIPFAITITDIYGNSTVCNGTLLVVDSFGICGFTFTNGYLVMGQLKTPFKTSIDNAKVDIQLDNKSNIINTEEQGYYTYPHIPPGTDVVIHPSKDDDYLNGVDILDLVYLTRYILGVSGLPNKYSKLAGDVNESHTLSVGDLSEIRRLILHLQDKFNCHKSWKFLDAKCDKDIPNNELSGNLPEEVNIPEITYHSLLNDFIAIKLGDVDFSSQSYKVKGELEVRNSDKAIIETKDVYLEKGKSYDIDLNLKDPELWEGIQAGFILSPEFSVNSYKAGGIQNMSEDNINLIKSEQEKLNLLWTIDDDNLPVSNNQLIQLNITSNSNTYLSQVLKLNTTDFNSKAYDKQLNVSDMTLEFKSPEILNEIVSTRIFSNRPNPFNSETIWPILVENNNTKVTLSITSLEGKLIYTNEYSLNSGYNEIKLDGNKLPGKGCYLYKIISSDMMTSGKIILH